MDIRIFDTVIAELSSKNYIDVEGVTNLAGIVETLSRRIHDLRMDMEFHPALQVLAAHYMNYVDRQRKILEDSIQQKWMSTYRYLREKGTARPSENQVMSILTSDPAYLCTLSQKRDADYFFEQLKELHRALIVRARMLEQISNNVRAEAKDESDDDLS
jgi:hypothetical protein